MPRRPTSVSRPASGKITEAMADQDVAADVRAVLDETKELLVAKHGFNRDEQEAYVREDPGPLLQPAPAGHRRPGGPAPLRKLSRHERFIGPAAELAERGIVPRRCSGRSPRRCASTTRPTPRPWSWRKSSPRPRRTRPRRRSLACRADHPLFAAVSSLIEEAKAVGLAAPAQRRSLRSRGLLGDAPSDDCLIHGPSLHFW